MQQNDVSKGRLSRIDALRALAVLLVVAWHLGFTAIPGLHGVAIFFVISGFVITRLMLRERERTGGFHIRAFYMRRLWKIMPPLIACIIVPSILLFNQLKLSVGAVTSQLLFTFNYWRLINVSPQDAIDHNFRFLPGSQVLWSLSVEEQFYILAALIWLFVVTRKHAARLLFISYAFMYVASMVWRFAYEVHSAQTDPWSGRIWVDLATDCRISSIALGGLVAIAFHAPEILSVRIHSALNRISSTKWSFYLGFGVMALTCIHFSPKLISSHQYAYPVMSFEITCFEIGTAIVILSSLNQQAWPKLVSKIADSKLIQTIGLASYSIYLVHLTVYIETKSFLSEHVNQRFLFPVTMMICVGAGLIVHYTFDRPFERQREKWRKIVKQQS